MTKSTIGVYPRLKSKLVDKRKIGYHFTLKHLLSIFAPSLGANKLSRDRRISSSWSFATVIQIVDKRKTGYHFRQRRALYLLSTSPLPSNSVLTGVESSSTGATGFLLTLIVPPSSLASLAPPGLDAAAWSPLAGGKRLP